MNEQNNINAKCPFCGAELYVGYDKGSGLCTACKSEFDNAQALKLYSAIHSEENSEEKNKTLSGEEYLEIDRILNRVEFYLEHNDYEKARADLEKALAINSQDFRIHFGFVRVETKNLTDYKNTTHEKYLNDAIACASADDKAVILRLYKDFYHLSKLSDEEILQYKKEENVAIKAKLEEKFKALIPVYMKKERTQKTNGIIGIILLVLSAVALTLGFVLTIDLLFLGGAVALIVGYFLLRNFLVGKRVNKMFNALLDFYDQFDTFEFDELTKREVLDRMKICRKAFNENNNTNGYNESLFELMTFVCKKGGERARRYVLSHEVLKEYVAEDEQ